MKVATVMTSDPDTLDPGRADDEQKNAIVLESQETLFRLIDGELTEAGCESYETSDDGLTWTFHLRDNKYSDGEDCKSSGLCKLYPPYFRSGSQLPQRRNLLLHRRR